MSQKLIPELLFEQGFTDLISVIPPDAPLVPTSKIAPGQLGKVPGVRKPSGLWAGYDWRTAETTLEDARRFALDGANVGLRADRFPGVDIDTKDPSLARIIEQAAAALLGPAPVRTGAWPKRLMMYRTDEPFTRLRLWIGQGDNPRQHLIEILGQGQQYLVHGTHPGTRLPYTWDVPAEALVAATLTTITLAKVQAFLDHLVEQLDLLGLVCEREGTGRPQTRTPAADQTGLLAPSVDVLREAVALIPNRNDLYPARTDYLRMGYAIRGAAGEAHEDDAYAIFADWASRWDGGVNPPDVVRGDWRRMRGPYAVGWHWIIEQARPFGFVDAALDFDPVDLGEDAEPDVVPEPGLPRYSEQWCARRIVDHKRGELRYVPTRGTWLVWSEGRFRPDADLLAEALVKDQLAVLAQERLREAATDKERAAAEAEARQLLTARKVREVMALVKSDRAIAVSADALDHDPWVLNTPAGIVDLRTGTLGLHDPDQLCTRVTAVPPDFGGAMPIFRSFLDEVTGGDAALQGYLQRSFGYTLTGSTREQHLTYLWGPGGNGKSVLQNVVAGILHDYARTAPMDAFLASPNDRHSTEIAMLQGARLVVASETAGGKRWDETRVKSITGGEPITARYMRQDNFTFLPQCKLFFVGNHKPEIRDVDAAMRRRIHLVPFTVTPRAIDRELGAKLREEWPAILAWMIEGCLAWQREGLNPPPIVRGATEDYFADNDLIGAFLAERCEVQAGATVASADLWGAWSEWAHRNGAFVGSQKRLAEQLSARGYAKWREPITRRNGFKGLSIRQDFEAVA